MKGSTLRACQRANFSYARNSSLSCCINEQYCNQTKKKTYSRFLLLAEQVLVGFRLRFWVSVFGSDSDSLELLVSRAIRWWWCREKEGVQYSGHMTIPQEISKSATPRAQLRVQSLLLSPTSCECTYFFIFMVICTGCQKQFKKAHGLSQHRNKCSCL